MNASITFTLNGSASNPIDFSNPWSNFASTGGVSPFPPFVYEGIKPSPNYVFPSITTVPAAFRPNFKLGITQSWNLSLEQSFGQQFVMHLAYVGAESFHQATTVDQNPGGFVCPPGSVVNPNNCDDVRSTYPNFSRIIQVQPAATSSYNALQAGIEKRFSHGLQFQSNFTWSHTFDVGGSGDPSFESSVSDPHDIGHDHGPSSLNYPIVSVSNFLYESPSLNGHNVFMKNILGTWQISGLVTLQSGSPFTVNGGNGNNNSGFQINQDRADLTGEPFNVRQGGKSNWLNHYFNPGAFKQNAAGTPGNSPKFLLQGVPIKTIDLGIAKSWYYRERYRLQFRWEAFNAFNHPSFGQPDSNPPTPDPNSPNSIPPDSTFGKITSIGSIAPRVMQGALKLTF